MQQNPTSRRLAVALTVVVLASPGTTVAQTPAPAAPAAPPASRTVLFTASGGIAKGSYQGGVDWTITEFLRRTRNAGFRRALGLGDARYTLGAATGASAGNINALFAAIHYCTQARQPGAADTEPIPAEQSLFWKAWINTGTPELLPDGPNGGREPAALDRTFFLSEYLPAIEAALEQSVAIDGCDVPVGLTLTRIEPVQVELVENSSASALVQRFASVFTVRRAADGHLEFAAASPAIEGRRSLGALALLDRDAAGRIAAKTVFEVAVASSSFPVAFAPRLIEYYRGGLAAPGAPGGRTLETAAFSDGGVFDNNPMGLALGLYEQRASPASSVDLVYSSPGNFREPMLGARRPPAPDAAAPPPTGLDAATSLLSGAYNAAREYELQAFARQLARDRNDVANGNARVIPELRLSSRAHAIVGETLASFGAFLGRPFREHDFYAGIYDGFELVAREYLCRGRNDLAACTREQQTRIVEENLFDLSDDADAAVTWLLHREHGTALPERTSPRWTLLRAILEGVPDPAARQREADAGCKARSGLMDRHLCPGGLATLIARLRSAPAVRTAVADIRRACEASVATGTVSDCAVDAHFVDLLDKPEVHLYKLEKKAIENLELAEDHAQSAGARNYTGLVEIAHSVFRISTYRYRDGAVGPFEFVMSSARGKDPVDTLALGLGFVLPSYFQWTYANGRKDNLAFGWRPVTWVWSDTLHVNYTTEVSLTGLSKGPFLRQAVSQGVGLGTFALPRKLQLLSAVELGAFFPADALWNSLPGATPGARTRDRAMARLTVRGLADKIQLSLSGRKDMLTFSLAVNDLNGTVFWIFR